VPHVNVGAAAIEEKATVSRWFVPVALMQVRQSQAVFIEDPVANPADSTRWTGGVVG
jgi:hypothetical protein